MRLTAIRLVDIRGFAGEHVVPIDAGLTVLMGPNNVGKTTLLRAPFLGVPPSRAMGGIAGFARSAGGSCAVAVQLELSADEVPGLLGFTLARVDDILVPNGGRDVPLHHCGQFTNWKQAPRVELGMRWAGGSVERVLRLLGDPGAYVEITPGNVPTAVVGKRSGQARADHGWFDAAWQTLESGRLPAATFAYWEHNPVNDDWLQQPVTRRCLGTREDRLQEVLTFLRLKFPGEFTRIDDAVRRALPELNGIDFLDSGSSFAYRPGFVLPTRPRAPLARESVGAGVWSFLCIMAAARSAKATGARVLFLDEPHLHLHPGLERLLVEELVDPKKWDDEPLQIVMSTHSPTFVNAAAEQGTLHVLGWRDRAKGELEFKTLPAGAGIESVLGPFVRPSDVLYASAVVFVEGPSDVGALRMLARHVGAPPDVRFVPLREADAMKSELGRYFSVIAQARGPGIHTPAVLVLDADKKATYEAAWDKLERDRDPRKMSPLGVVFAGQDGNDLESCFCDARFLSAYFAGGGTSSSSSVRVIRKFLARIKETGDKASKGCTAIRALHAKLLGENDNDGTKLDDLEKLMAFYLKSPEAAHAATVRTRLEPLEQALKALRGV